MKLTDVNLLLYAVDAGSPRHVEARAWLEERLSGVETFAFPVAVLLAFVRLSTQGRIFSSPLAPNEAFDIIDGWLAQPCATTVVPGERHLVLVRELLEPLGAAGNLVSDAHLAAWRSSTARNCARPTLTSAGFSAFAGRIRSRRPRSRPPRADRTRATSGTPRSRVVSRCSRRSSAPRRSRHRATPSPRP